MKPSIEDLPKLELKKFPEHLGYALLEDNSKLPVIIASNLEEAKKGKLFNVLNNHKGALAWKVSDNKGISPTFCT